MPRYFYNLTSLVSTLGVVWLYIELYQLRSQENQVCLYNSILLDFNYYQAFVNQIIISNHLINLVMQGLENF